MLLNLKNIKFYNSNIYDSLATLSILDSRNFCSSLRSMAIAYLPEK